MVPDSLNPTTLGTILVSDIATCNQTTPPEAIAEPNCTAGSIDATPRDTVPHASDQSALVTHDLPYATNGPSQSIQER